MEFGTPIFCQGNNVIKALVAVQPQYKANVIVLDHPPSEVGFGLWLSISKENRSGCLNCISALPPSKDNGGHNSSHLDSSISYRSTNRRHESNVSASCSSSKRVEEGSYSREDEGLRDEEINEFLQSRVKHGRGSIGSRMYDTGPYLPTSSTFPGKLPTTSLGMEHLVKLGPEKPSSLRHDESFFDSDPHVHRKKKDKDDLARSDKKHSKKHKSKEKGRDK
ncbi:uncharacterized protein LOC120134254 [Hibiscus syriacus]|uniref:uncharacterized protein LOC120134254 n=1 Tax=Hibiscus syriacus TaxID=106335 RepID=UPI0019208AA3|nr:uncharacterized protein LOC120134254 [Hibiscus syriacus]